MSSVISARRFAVADVDDAVIGLAIQLLIGDRVGVVARSGEVGDQGRRKILVELEFHAALV